MRPRGIWPTGTPFLESGNTVGPTSHNHMGRPLTAQYRPAAVTHGVGARQGRDRRAHSIPPCRKTENPTWVDLDHTRHKIRLDSSCPMRGDAYMHAMHAKNHQTEAKVQKQNNNPSYHPIIFHINARKQSPISAREASSKLTAPPSLLSPPASLNTSLPFSSPQAIGLSSPPIS
ncbi:hypothetical protein MUK42_27233 [Musa troglodytarum]|uniref:Uncharacterized protein n=1 Tax=Musa troglodytarum TaxID=320322 RepID=A0A9E7K7Q4_9LILI|nr:hypothetical protein MUK42_27233 [Musa troglodytarum]